MYLSIFKEDVIDGLQKAAGIIPQRTGAAYLRSIWLRVDQGKLEILSTDSNIEFRGSYVSDITKEGLIGVQGRAFVDLIRRLPSGSDKIVLETSEDNSVLHISQGRRKYKLPTNDKNWFQNFSDFPEEGAVVWSGDYLQELIERISFCIADDGMDAISCFVLKPKDEDGIEAVGMNGHQFAMMKFVNEDLHALLPQEGILIQKKYLTEIRKWLGSDEIEINIENNRLFLRTEDQKESFSVPLSSYQYHDYSVFLNRINEEGNSSLKLKRDEAMDALNRIEIFNTDSNRCTYFTFTPEEAILSISEQETGSASEYLDVKYEGDIEKIAFHTSKLLSIFEHYNSNELSLTFTGTEGPCGIKGPDDKEYHVIIMPMKIIEDTQFTEEQV